MEPTNTQIIDGIAKGIESYLAFRFSTGMPKSLCVEMEPLLTAGIAKGLEAYLRSIDWRPKLG